MDTLEKIKSQLSGEPVTLGNHVGEPIDLLIVMFLDLGRAE
jgi:hypothetical protein